jgi:DNA polymerase V
MNAMLLRPALDPEALPLPLLGRLVPAGFPSPADDHLDRDLDLHELLIQHPAATYFVRLAGDSMQGAGLYDGDLLIVDRSLSTTTEVMRHVFR